MRERLRWHALTASRSVAARRLLMRQVRRVVSGALRVRRHLALELIVHSILGTEGCVVRMRSLRRERLEIASVDWLYQARNKGLTLRVKVLILVAARQRML